MPFIIPANTLASGSYDVDNSCRFNPSSSDYLSRTNGTPTNAKKFTWSAWFKKTTGAMNVAGNKYDTSNYAYFYFRGTDDLRFFDRSGGADTVWVSDALFRDVSAWYHLVISVDTTQATDTNRFKVYVNGVQDTGNGITYPALNADMAFNKATASGLSRIATNQDTGSFFNGYMSEIVYIDGQQLDPTSFGEFDEDSGIWKPISISGLTFGNNGFYLEFGNSGALGTDSSGEGNTFAVNNLTAIDQSTDTCTNNFATWNALDNYAPAATFAEGNLQITTGGSNIHSHNNSTIAVSNGKWYAEVKVITTSTDNFNMIGISAESPIYYRSSPWGELGDTAFAYAYVGNDGKIRNNGSVTSYGNSYSTSIIGIYLDLDNNKLYFSKDGTLQNSGTGVSITAAASTPTGHYFFAAGNDHDNNAVYSANFGSPAFAISSGNTDGEYGNFEYSTTITGDGASKTFKALNTKNLSEFG